MNPTLSFGDLLEAADHLSEDEQVELVAVLRRRLAEAGRRRLADDIRQSRAEFAAGQCTVMTPAELMNEITK